MKRIGGLLASAFLGSLIVGCDRGLQEGSPAEAPKTAQTPEFKELMQKNADKMLKQTKPKNLPKAGP